MSLAQGARLGPYEIAAPLGAGGMGEVYRATDTKLDREVAIKLLPEAFADDPERLARFEREAKLLASLNHPNIAHVYGFESATLPDGSPAHFLAIELIEGEDLAQRLERGAISVDEALGIARQMADARERESDGRSLEVVAASDGTKHPELLVPLLHASLLADVTTRVSRGRPGAAGRAEP